MFSFGLLESIRLDIGTLALVSVGLFLILFEYLTNAIDYMKDYYPAAYHMIQKLYKELMIMGVVSFSIVMIESSGYLAHTHTNTEWIQAIDFAHILLFFMALFFVVHACFLIYVSMSLATEYQQMHFIEIHEILKRIKSITSRWSIFFYRSKFSPGTEIRHLVEFKIIHGLFRDCYSLPLLFNYPLYLTGCHEKYALALLDIGVFGYGTIMIFAGLNYAIYSGIKTAGLGCSYAVEVHNDDETNHLCVPIVYLFVISGYVMLLWSVMVRVMARVVELRLIARAGATSVGDYERLLRKQMTEDKNRQLIKKLKKEVSIRALKDGVDVMRQEQEYQKTVILRKILDVIFLIDDFFVRIKRKLTATSASGDSSKTVRQRVRWHSWSITERKQAQIGPFTASGGGASAGGANGAGNSSNGVGVGVGNSDGHGNSSFDKRRGTVFNTRNFTHHTLDTIDKDLIPDSSSFKIKHKEDFSEIYFLKNRMLFFRVVEVTVMMNCFWMAMW
eukprot:gene10434-21775_t